MQYSCSQFELIIAITCQIVAILAGKAVYSCGSGQNGRLGLGSQNSSDEYASIEALEDAKIHQISCGLDHSLVLAEL